MESMTYFNHTGQSNKQGGNDDETLSYAAAAYGL